MPEESSGAPRKEEWEYWRRIQEEVRLSRNACERLRSRGRSEADTRADIAAAIQAELEELERVVGEYEEHAGDSSELRAQLEESMIRLRAFVRRAEDALKE